ncbi:hypothetical protein P7C70_g1283, partial [Phenoliferia sp. Uapishka_3]
MTATPTHTTILDLAPETLALAFEFVEVGDTAFFIGTDLHSLKHASLVCRNWRDLAQRQLCRHQFLWGPLGSRRAVKYLESDVSGRYPVEHLEVLGIPVPMNVLELCWGLRALTLEGIKALDADFFHHPHLANLKRLSLGGVRMLPSTTLASTPTSIQLNYLSTDLLSMPEALSGLFESSSTSLKTLRLYLSSRRDTQHLLDVFPFIASSLTRLDFHAHLPSEDFHSLLSTCTSLTAMGFKAAEAYKPLILLAEHLPPSVRRLTFNREAPSYAPRFILSLFSLKVQRVFCRLISRP